MRHIEVDCSTTGVGAMNCNGYISTDPHTHEAFVFVHGFRGDNDPTSSRKWFGLRSSAGTWRGFEDLILHDDYFESVDVYLIAYSSVLADTHTNAAKLLAFLYQQLNVGDGDSDGPSLRCVSGTFGRSFMSRDNPEPYDKVTFLAHSEGAVVVRKAIVRAHKAHTSSPNAYVNGLVSNATVRLFAPAQGGHRIGGLADAAVDAAGELPLVGGFASFLKLAHPAVISPAYQDMDAGSLGLDQLRSDTESIQMRPPTVRSLWAENDKVVEAVDYSTDLPSLFLTEADHRNVCKPDQGRRADLMAFVSSGDTSRPVLRPGSPSRLLGDL